MRTIQSSYTSSRWFKANRQSIRNVHAALSALFGILLASASPAIGSAANSPFVPLHEFSLPTPTRPIQGKDGNLYGAIYGGLPSGFGSIYKVSPGGTETVLYRFSGAADGANPMGALVQGSDGNFYGTTSNGGTAGFGTIFKITPAGVLTTLHSFALGEGERPAAELIQGQDGSFYGTAPYGGAHGNGTVFRITSAGAFTTLYSFAAYDNQHLFNADGANPSTALTLGNDGNLYGTTPNGSRNTGMTAAGATGGFGTIFKITPTGSLQILHVFSGVEGAVSEAPLLLSKDGNFYGTTTAGGSGAVGNLFRMTPAGVVTSIYSFGLEQYPEGPIFQGADGNFYGATPTDFSNGPGSVYQITPNGELYEVTLFQDATLGTNPKTGITLGSDGNIYGVTSAGGIGEGSGVLFKIIPGASATSKNTATALHSFTETGEIADQVSVAVASNGDLYGTAYDDVSYLGSNFRLTAAGVFASLHEFGYISAPTSLILASDDNFYGATGGDGAYGDGTIYQLTPQGTFTLLHSFNDNVGTGDGNEYVDEGYEPHGPLVQGPDGLLYGTCYRGGGDLEGTIFTCSTAGAFKHYDTLQGSDAGYPENPLAFGDDGLFYGASFLGGSTFVYGGTGGKGAIFASTSSGQVVNLYSFTGGKDGAYPGAGLVKGADGNLYGTTSSTIFKITPQGVLTTLYTFTGGSDGSGSGDGSGYGAPLLLGKDGNFYGTTVYGGIANELGGIQQFSGYGTIFKMTPAGELTTLYTFTNGSDGGSPKTPLVQGADGNLYGATGGPYGGTSGVVFKLDLSAVITSTTKVSGVAGTAFSYQIAAVNSPTSFAATGLPGGLSINPSTGLISGTLAASGVFTATISATNVNGTGKATLEIDSHPAFFKGEAALSNDVYYLTFPTGNYFGYYSFLTDPAYIYHFDLGYEYVFDAKDGKNGVYFYDFKSDGFFYTSPSFPFPYLYDFSLSSVLYYYPDPKTPGHYNTNGVRYFYDFATGKIISK